MSRWVLRAICDIDKSDVLAVIDETLERSFWQAHHVFAYISRIFNWALERDAYGLDRSPCDRLRPAKIIGAKEPRTRILSDKELRALWHASNKLGYPLGPFVRLLMLTGQRRSEAAERERDSITYRTVQHQAALIAALKDELALALRAVNAFAKAITRRQDDLTKEIGELCAKLSEVEQGSIETRQ